MLDELRRLLQSHEFLHRALEEHGDTLCSKAVDNLRRERDRVFFELVSYTSSHPQVTLAQLRFLLSGLFDLASDPEQVEALSQTCLQTAERLAGDLLRQDQTYQSMLALPATERPVGSLTKSVSPQEAWLLDSMSDRASVYGLDYQYLFTNKANAAFHGMPAADFIGCPSHTIVGDRCFRELTKPSLDKCFAGHPLDFAVSHRVGRKKLTYAASVEPVRDAGGNIVGALVTTKDVTHYAVQAERVWPGRDE
jgi:PAS domain-containing protein